MMIFTKTYFLPPTSDFLPPPPEGPLRLGSIISSTALPQSPLNLDAVAAVPASAVQTFTETNWKKKVSTTTSAGLGVYAQFLQLAGFGAELSGEHSKTDGSVLAFKALTTQSFEPDTAYLAEALKAPGVQHFMRKNFLGRRKPVLLVTGLKVVEGANVRYTENTSSSVRGQFGVDTTIASVPTTVGPKGHWSKVTDSDTSFERPSEFLFAFRVLQLSYKSNEVKSAPYSAGAFLGKDDQTASDEVLEVTEIAIADGSGLPAIDEADGAEVLCVASTS
jgi:hypothetical protein